MFSLILLLVFPFVAFSKPLMNESTTADFEEIVVTNDELMGGVEDLNPFDKQVIVDKTVQYFRRHLSALDKAVRRLNDEQLFQSWTYIESQLNESEDLFQQNADLKLFHDRMALLSIKLIDLQTKIIERLDVDQVVTEAVNKEALPVLYGRYQIADEVIELRLQELWTHLKDFTHFVEDVLDDIGDKKN